MAKTVRGKCPKCGTKIEADLTPRRGIAFDRHAFDRAWAIFDKAFSELTKAMRVRAK